MKIAFALTQDSISASCNGKSYSIPKTHPNYLSIKKAIKEDNVEDFEKLADIPKTIETNSNSNLKIENNKVYYKNNLVNDKINTRILSLIQEDLPFTSLLRFIDNIEANTSKRSTDELFNFLDHRALPLTDDGCFFAYKRVTDDWKDFHTKTFDNKVGKRVEMARNQVDDDFRHDCSDGLHVGTIEYVRDFNTGTGHIVIVKVNPKDVVSVPVDCSSQKCRVCAYDVVAEYTGELNKSPVYNQNLEPCYSKEDEDEDEDFDDEDEDEDEEDEDFDDEDEDEEDEDFDDEDEDNL